MTYHDEFHPPTNSTTCSERSAWFAFSVPERKLAGWNLPVLPPNEGARLGPAFVWDAATATRRSTAATTSSSSWHFPPPDGPLSDVEWENGLGYTVRAPMVFYHLPLSRRRRPLVRPHLHRGDGSALDQDVRVPTAATSTSWGRFTGTLVLDGETIEVDWYVYATVPWGARSLYGPYLMSAGEWKATEMPYSHGTVRRRRSGDHGDDGLLPDDHALAARR